MMFGQNMMNISMGGGSDDLFSMDRRRVGINLATVVDIEDPEKLGRVKCEFITADEDAGEAEWAFVATPMAGKKSGMFFHPSVDDVVLLAFEEGNIHAPFVIGSIWWDNGDITSEPPVEEPNKPEIYLITTPKGNKITLSEAEDKEFIEIKTAKGHELKLDDKENKITLLSEGGEGITLDTQEGAMSIKCKKFELEVDGNKFSIEKSGCTLECKPSIDIKSTKVTIDGSGSADINGKLVNINADTAANIKGQVVKIN